MNTHDILSVQDCHVVVRMMKREFDAHDFIIVYAEIFSNQYIAMARQYEFKLNIVNSQISKFIRDHSVELHIERVTNDDGHPVVLNSENIKTRVSQNSAWRKIEQTI